MKTIHQFSHIRPPLDTLLRVGFADGRECDASLVHPRRADGWVLPVLLDGSGNVLAIYVMKPDADKDEPVWWRCVDTRCDCRGDGRCSVG